MLKKDALTIAIVIICIAALIYLVYGAISVMGKEKPGGNSIEESTLDSNLPEDDGTYKFEDEEADTSTLITSDLDDEQLTEDYGEEEDLEFDDSEEDNAAPEEDENEDFQGAEVGDYMVLAGAFRILQNAENQAKNINSFSCCSKARVSLFNRGAFATVLVDRFDNQAEAQNLVDELTDEGIEAIVQKKR